MFTVIVTTRVCKRLIEPFANLHQIGRVEDNLTSRVRTQAYRLPPLHREKQPRGRE